MKCEQVCSDKKVEADSASIQSFQYFNYVVHVVCDSRPFRTVLFFIIEQNVCSTFAKVVFANSVFYNVYFIELDTCEMLF